MLKYSCTTSESENFIKMLLEFCQKTYHTNIISEILNINVFCSKDWSNKYIWLTIRDVIH